MLLQQIVTPVEQTLGFGEGTLGSYSCSTNQIETPTQLDWETGYERQTNVDPTTLWAWNHPDLPILSGGQVRHRHDVEHMSYLTG